MINRRPRIRPPTDVDDDIVQKANQNGVVDLTKIKKYVEQRKEERYARARKAAGTRAEKLKLAKDYNELSMEIAHLTHNFRKERFVSFKQDEKTIIRRRYKADVDRLWDIYKYLIIKYESSKDTFYEYISHAIKKAFSELNLEKETSIFGFVVSEKSVDSYLFESAKRYSIKQRVNSLAARAQEHARYFQDDE